MSIEAVIGCSVHGCCHRDVPVRPNNLQADLTRLGHRPNQIVTMSQPECGGQEATVACESTFMNSTNFSLRDSRDKIN